MFSEVHPGRPPAAPQETPQQREAVRVRDLSENLHLQHWTENPPENRQVFTGGLPRSARQGGGEEIKDSRSE